MMCFCKKISVLGRAAAREIVRSTGFGGNATNKRKCNVYIHMPSLPLRFWPVLQFASNVILLRFLSAEVDVSNIDF